MASTSLTISMFNIHGFRNGVNSLSNLCKTSDLVAAEEHPGRQMFSNVSKLHGIQQEFHVVNSVMSW